MTTEEAEGKIRELVKVHLQQESAVRLLRLRIQLHGNIAFAYCMTLKDLGEVVDAALENKE